jgi:glycerophosphoryl diester phosphodiesterase
MIARFLPAIGRRSRGKRWRRPGALPRIWAHRGDSAHRTENTLEAFAAARAAGADGIELDVMPCRSGELVVFHDETLERLAGRPERIAALSLAELRAVRLAGDGRISTLREVLDATGDLEVNVEIKSPGPGKAGAAPAEVAKIVRDAGAAGRVLVSSFDPWALVQLHGLVPDLATALLFHAGEPMPARRGWIAPWIGASAMHPEHVLCTAATVGAWRRAGYAVNVWTVDDPARLRQLAAMGVDGVFANDPAAARAALTAAPAPA